MHHLQHMCALQLHKLASEQMPSDAALVEFVHMRHNNPDPGDQARRDDQDISGTSATGETLSSGRPFSPTR